MKAINYISISSALLAILFLANGCSPAGGEKRGHEYMPDMAHSIAYEANTVNYYSHNTWGTEEELQAMSMPRKPVNGTVARGYAGVALAGSAADRKAAWERLQNERFNLNINGAVPYHYGDTDAERERASAEITSNPFPPTASGMESGKALYDVNCGICHGDSGAGDGYLVRDDGGAYPAQPAILTDAKFITASEGQLYHAIMHGKGMMGGYSDKLSYEERWEVIHYIRSLQATSQGKTYALVDENATANSFVEAAEEEVDVEAAIQALIEKVKTSGAANAGSITLNNVQFNTGSDKLKSESEGDLMKLVNILKNNEGLRVEISGHTDNKGKESSNQRLSEKRAKAVKKFLVEHGIDGTQLEAVGFGPSQPVADNDTEEGRARNRRTEFKIIE